MKVSVLTEIESKDLLRRYGIETTAPKIAKNAQQASEIAQDLKKPVAMKVVSKDIIHKLDAGGVYLNVQVSDTGVVYEKIISSCKKMYPDALIDGVLLEEMIPSGGTEIFIGARNDPEYGDVLLLGYGGSGVEGGRPPKIILTPLNRSQAKSFITETFADIEASVLTEQVVNKLADYLLAVAGEDGMLAKKEICDLDINPVIVIDNRCIAVDGVAQVAVVDSPTKKDVGHKFSTNKELEQILAKRTKSLAGMSALFEPESIAFIGASTSPAKLGYRCIKNLVDFEYRGNLYPVHPKATEIYGVKAYPSILDIPGKVDRAYIALSAQQVPNALKDCVKKGVKVTQVLTAGFSEWSDSEDSSKGIELENEILSVIKDTDMRMVGPNCIGTFSAGGRVSMGAARFNPIQPKGVTFISQSGTFAGDVVRRAQVLGVPVAQVLSCGNSTDLDMVDYLLFCESDPNTELIAFYIESIRNPGLFFRTAQRSKKPIVLFKGGTTDQGITAASSHTSALATDKRLWQAGVKQCGILQVESIDDLMDVFLVHTAHKTLLGNRLGVFGSGGGVSVTASDTASLMDMSVPSLSEKTGTALQKFGVPGTSVANPIDIPVWGLKDSGEYILGKIINILKEDPVIDSLIVYVEMGSIMDFADDDETGLYEIKKICDSIGSSNSDGANITVALRSTGDKVQEDFIRSCRISLLRKNIAVFNSTSRAVKANAKLHALTKHKRLSQVG